MTGNEINAFGAGEYFQRVGFLARVPQLLRKSGANSEEVLAAAGLSEHALDDPEGTILYGVMGLLLEIAAEKTGCPHFGMEIGKTVRTASLGLLGELMRNSPTVRVALRDFAFHQHLNAHGGAAYLLEDKHQAFFGYAIYQARVPGAHHIYDGAATAAFSLVCELVGIASIPFLKVLLCRSEPRLVTPYQETFGARLVFNSKQTAVAMPLEMLDRRIAGSDSQLRLALEKRVKARTSASGSNTLMQLQRGLRVRLLEGDVSAIGLASHLGMSGRTLNRRLSRAGIRFQKILDETRFEFVQQLLANTQLSVGKIAAIVGYSDRSAFTRSFIRVAGVAPSEWRLTLRSQLSQESIA